ncbi:MAG TPA: 50S ribosomal protein L7Ae-like protein [Firmicutes bacterium]|nr:50S ribosomal protein L7Ae-like protein [Bacillota bacterium]HWR55511.1 ribosomal L7Ae/L30e/S12e/Gadd45 family protein [Negativicutes bacterium]
MTVEKIKKARKRAIGSKQTMKAIEKGIATVVYLARDADEHVLRPLIDLCTSRNINLVWVDTMLVLGKACGIEVGSAAAAVIEE